MINALDNHEGTVSIGGRKITNLRFADDIDGLAGEEKELANWVECLEKTSAAYGMEIRTEKTKLMTNNNHGISTEAMQSQRTEAWASNKLQVPGISYHRWGFQTRDTCQECIHRQQQQ